MLLLKIQHVCDGFSRDVLPFENPVGFSMLDFHICFLSFFSLPHTKIQLKIQKLKNRIPATVYSVPPCSATVQYIPYRFFCTLT